MRYNHHWFIGTLTTLKLIKEPQLGGYIYGILNLLLYPWITLISFFFKGRSFVIEELNVFIFLFFSSFMV